MNIRIGYVSNSSSASSVVFGHVVGNIFTGNVTLDDDKEYIMEGCELCDGTDVITLDKELLDWFRDNQYNKDMDFRGIDGDIIEVVWSASEPSGVRVPERLEDCRLWVFKKDMHSTRTVKDAETHYKRY